MSKTKTSRMALFSILAFFLAVGFFTGCGKDEVDISTPFQDKVVRIVLSTEQKLVKSSVDWEEKFSKRQEEE